LVSLFTKSSSNNYREEGAIAFPKVGSFSINFPTSKLRKDRIFVDIIEGIKEKTFLIFNMKKVQYLIAAIFLLKQEKKRFYIVYSLSWVASKKTYIKEPSLGKEFFTILLLYRNFFLIRDIIS